jgi:hypothetical protein
MTRPPAPPSRNGFNDQELEAYEGLVTRERNRGKLEANGLPGGYFGALLNSPVLGYLIASLGRTTREVGDREGSFSHAQREWVDQVLSVEFGTNVVLGVHIPDALVRGVRLDAIRALRGGREDELTDDERLLAVYIRQVVRGEVTDESFAAIEAHFGGTRGAVEYTIFIMFLVLTMRLISALTGRAGASNDEVAAILEEYANGTRPIPTEVLEGAG